MTQKRNKYGFTEKELRDEQTRRVDWKIARVNELLTQGVEDMVAWEQADAEWKAEHAWKDRKLTKDT